MRTHCFFLLLFMWTNGAIAQVGVRATLFHFEQQTGRSGLNWSIGLDHDPSDRTSIGVDFISQMNLFSEAGDRTESTEYDGYNVFYGVARTVKGLQFRSTYFISAYGNAGFYMGTYVGFRSIELTVAPEVSSSGFGSPTPNWARTTTTSTMVFPVGLRWGLRSEMDTWYQDVYFATGFQLGAGNATLPPFLLAKDKLKGFSIQAGYAIGFGG
ncbi:MAG: hypothetical protein WEC15_02785 [Flavobacteriales bacterium]